MTRRFTDTAIQVRIVPTRLRWPEAGTNIAWTKAHDCVVALQYLVRNVDLNCLRAEENKELSAGAIRRRRTEICEEAMKTLASFKPFHIAEKTVIENIVSLEQLVDRDHEQVQMHEKLGQALRDLREGVEATRRMVLDRCKMRESASV